jgi:GTP-binding protein HflX
MWTHLSRQTMGVGMRGPGEKQLELDRRLIGEKVKMLKAKLAAAEMRTDACKTAFGFIDEP